MDKTTREVETTKYQLSPKGICIQARSVHKEANRCPILPPLLLQQSDQYNVERSPPNGVRHVYACGGAGTCRQRVREFRTFLDDRCGCRWKYRDSERVCCCAIAAAADKVPPKFCDPGRGVLVDRKTEWELQAGVCRPTVHEKAVPISKRKLIAKHTFSLKPSHLNCRRTIS